MLQRWPNALENAGLKTQYIFVDEFQDTDVNQFELLRILCKDHAHITIVGDDDQQIYSWNDQCETTAIVDFITSLRKQGVPLQEIAIMYRLQRMV